MITVREAPRDHLDWIAARAQVVPGAGFYALEAIDGDRIVGMVGFDGWTPNAVVVHIALDYPAVLRSLLRPGFGLIFDDPPRGMGRGVAVATILSTNRASLRLADQLGFREVMRGRNWWERGVDMIWLEMRRDECRWLRPTRKAA